MVQPHSTFTESQFHPKPLSNLLLLRDVYSVFKIKRAVDIFMPHFSAEWLYFLAAIPQRMNQGYIKMHQKDGLMKMRIFHCDFLEVGKSKSKQEALLVLEPIEEFYQVGCWSHISPTQLKKLKERKPTGCWDGRCGVSRAATVWRQNEEEQYPHEH